MPKTVEFYGGRMILYSRHEIAKMLGISERTVWQYIKDERLPAVMIDHRLYVWDKNLVAFLAGAKSTHHKHKVNPQEFHNQNFYT